MHHTYILVSEVKQRYYVGFTSNVEARLKAHNSGKTKSTKPYIPWRVVYLESFECREDAWHRERQIKSYKGGRAFKALIES